MMLVDKQILFTENIGKLIYWAYKAGFGLTFGDAFRDRRQSALNAQQGKGIANSLHTCRLAVDFNLFIDGIYQAQSGVYRPLGEHWKSLHPDNRWGGDFRPVPDGNHFSMSDGGIK